MVRVEDYITVIDDFYDEPYLIRDIALKQNYRDPFIENCDRTLQFMSQRGAYQQRADISNELQDFTVRKLLASLEMPVHDIKMQFRYSLAGSPKRQVCHVDSDGLAAIIYLTLPENCCGGTAFFRNRQNGQYYIGDESQTAYRWAEPGDWELVHQVDMKFNRMIFYLGKLFHSPALPLFGTTIENGRLSQNIFIEPVAGCDFFEVARQNAKNNSRIADPAAI